MNDRLIWVPAKWLPNVAGALSFFLTLFCGLVIYDTLKMDTNITMEQFNYARGWNNSTGLVVEYSRGFTIHNDADGEVQRVIRCPPNGDTQDAYFIEGPSTRRTFTKGYYAPVKRPMQFPITVPAGTLCRLEVWGVWRPRFAISSKRFMLDSHDFVIQEKP